MSEPITNSRTKMKRWSLMCLLRVASYLSLLLTVCTAGACNGSSNGGKMPRLTNELVEKLHRRRGLSDTVIKRLPERALNEEIAALDFDEEPMVSAAYNSTGQEEPAQPPPPLERSGLKSRFSLLMQGAVGASAAEWTEIGPANIGGRTRSIVIDPNNPQRIWAGSLGGGVWLSEDGGNSYRPLNDNLPSMVISCMVMKPGEPGVIYAGTGENYFRTVEGPRGAGILKIKEDGSWQQLKGTDGSDFRYVYRLAFSPDGSVLLAGTAAGLRRTTNPASGVWEKSQELNFKVGEVLFDPRDGNKALAAGLDHGEVIFSSDAGKSWQPATHPDQWDGRVVLTYAQANSSIVYASVPMRVGVTTDISDEIWASTDGGKSYFKRGSMTPNDNGAMRPACYSPWARFSSFIWAGDPTDERLVITGGVDIWRSTDGGEVLIPISTSYILEDPEPGKRLSRTVHVDQHCAVSDPNYDGVKNRRVYFCNDGGIYKTDDIKEAALDLPHNSPADWYSLNKTYAVTQFNSGNGDSSSGVILAGTQDNGTLYLAPGGGTGDWVEAGENTGDGGHSAIAPSDGLLFGESQLLQIFRVNPTNPSGVRSHEYIYGIFFCGTTEVPKWCDKPDPFLLRDVRRPVNWVAPFLLDPNNDRRLFAGGLSLWRTDDATVPLTNTSGPVWTVIKMPLLDESPISALTIAKSNSNIIWVAHNNGDVYRTDSGGNSPASWLKVDDAGSNALPQRMCTRLTLDPNNANTAFATFGGYHTENVYLTTDGGANWNPVSVGLPAVPVLTLTVHPKNSNRIFAGTAVGVYASPNGGKRWVPFGPNNSAVNHLFWIGDSLIAATYGRGMFKINLNG